VNQATLDQKVTAHHFQWKDQLDKTLAALGTLPTGQDPPNPGRPRRAKDELAWLTSRGTAEEIEVVLSSADAMVTQGDRRHLLTRSAPLARVGAVTARRRGIQRFRTENPAPTPTNARAHPLQ
jgi:hypothetical protein